METFDELYQRLSMMHGEGRYAAADTMLQNAISRYPDHRARILYWRVCMLTLSGQHDAAIACLRDALDEGQWYAESTLRDDPDLAALQDDPAFEALIARNAKRIAEAQKRITPYMAVKQPDDISGPQQLLIALHGNGSTVAESLPHWQPVTRSGWLLAMPESTQAGGSDHSARIWDNLDITFPEIHAHIADLFARFSIDRETIVLGGFSMGGQVAARLALKPDPKIRGLILVGAYLGPLQAEPDDLRQAAESGLRVYMITGKQDFHNYDHSLEFDALLRAYGIPTQLNVYTDLGHEYPPDFDEVLIEALDFVSG
jgi:predicted esterase